jgi:hypothetical protein
VCSCGPVVSRPGGLGVGLLGVNSEVALRCPSHAVGVQ